MPFLEAPPPEVPSAEGGQGQSSSTAIPTEIPLSASSDTTLELTPDASPDSSSDFFPDTPFVHKSAMELPWELQVRLKELENISPSHTRLIYRHRELERGLEEIWETPEYDTVGRAITAARRIEAIQHVLTLSLAAMDLEVFTHASKKWPMIVNQRAHVWKAVGERASRLKKGSAMMAQEREKISGNGRDFDQFEAEFDMVNVTLTKKLLVIEKMARGLPVEGMWLEKKGYAGDAERGFTEWAAKFGNATIPQ